MSIKGQMNGQVLHHFVNSTNSEKGKITAWLDGNEKPIVEYKGQTTIKKKARCRIHAGIYLNAALTAVDKHTTKDPTVWLLSLIHI